VAKPLSKLAMVLRSSLQTVLFAVILLASAGRLDLPWVWVLIGTHATMTLVAVPILVLRHPDLAQERLRPGPGVRAWDKMWVRVYILTVVGHLFLVGLDVGRFHWTDTVPVPVRVLAWGVFLGGLAFSWWAVAENAFFSSMVRVQEDRDHKVVSTGPYAWVRHPGYLGGCIIWYTAALVGGSWCALGTAALISLVYAFRIVREERVLREGLDGYVEYTRTVRYRLVPGVW
jgi:protein-S-isoprenylcysteine O-methyltransferase Ste14